MDPALLRRAKQEYRAQRGKLVNPRFINIVDFRKSIFQERLFVYNFISQIVVLSSRMAHGLQSRLLYPTEFSNVNGSERGCTGTFLTDKAAYSGRFEHALRMDDITEESNANVRTRANVFHANSEFYTYSVGYPMTNKAVNNQLIPLIQTPRFCSTPGNTGCSINCSTASRASSPLPNRPRLPNARRTRPPAISRFCSTRAF
ncbi:hypothetical protein GO988_14585 [Hymenobacter sp. HMF4947]|uniref:Uncharacterized protein n=1 Tax=Hymenobacter ginkgonis TaxID=2682976 RepID=A0A7K1TGP9_9BACT|nr:hypothetical protein [Hymenobacter ginkgonis]